MPRRITGRLICTTLSLVLLGACAKSTAETAASPVETISRPQELAQRSFGYVADNRGADGAIAAYILSPAPVVWDALVAALTERKVPTPILERTIGRVGDTAMVMIRQWNGKALSYYLDCGANITGQRADQDRIRAVFLAQLSRLKADTIGVSVHLSGTSSPVSGGNSSAPCRSRGRAEAEVLDDVIRRTGGYGVRRSG